jgi:hypothetical protein
MKKTIKLALTLTLLVSAPYFNVNGIKAENNSSCPSPLGVPRDGTILSLDMGLKSGMVKDDVSGIEYEFHYAGLEVLEVSADYVYIMQITASGKIIIRDIHRK